MSGRVGIIPSCKVSVERCNNGVLLSLLDVTSASKMLLVYVLQLYYTVLEIMQMFQQSRVKYSRRITLPWLLISHTHYPC